MIITKIKIRYLLLSLSYILVLMIEFTEIPHLIVSVACIQILVAVWNLIDDRKSNHKHQSGSLFWRMLPSTGLLMYLLSVRGYFDENINYILLVIGVYILITHNFVNTFYICKYAKSDV